MKAQFIRSSGINSNARLYRCEPGGPLPEYVVVSAVDAMFTGDETYIFQSNKDGEIVDWGELDGSFRGEQDHEQALRNAGYEPS